MLDKTLVKNITSLFGMRIAGYLIPLLTLPYLVRVLEPVGYGQLGFALAITQYFIILVNYGFDLSATQKIAQCDNEIEKVSEVFWNITFIRVFAAVVGASFLYFTTLISADLYAIKDLLFLCYISVIGTALFPQWLFQGKEQLGVISSSQVLFQLLNVPLVFFMCK